MLSLMQQIPVLSQGLLLSSQRAVIKTRRAWQQRPALLGTIRCFSYGPGSSLGGNLITSLNRACFDWYAGLYHPWGNTPETCLQHWVNSSQSRPTSRKKKISTNKHMKQSLTSLTSCEAQIKITLRFCFTPARKTVFKKRNSSNVRHDERWKNISLHCWWQNKLVWPLWKSGHKFLKKV